MTSERRLPHDWFSAPLPSNVEIGPGSWLYSTFAFLHYCSRRPLGLHVGHDSGLYDGTFFDLGPTGEVQIGNYCSVVGAIFSTAGRVILGDYVFIAHEVVIADRLSAVPPDTETTALSQPADVFIADNAWIGMRATLLAGARIGEGAIVGAAAVVDFEVPPFCIVAGNPARIVGSVLKLA